jgi:hypothetical protein
MDNNTNQPTQPSISSQETSQPKIPDQQPVTLEQPSPAQPTNANPDQSASSNKPILVFVILTILVVVLAVGGYYYYFNSKKSEEPAPSPQNTTQAPIATPTPPPTLNQMEQEVNSMNIEDTDGEFTQVDQDLQNL